VGSNPTLSVSLVSQARGEAVEKTAASSDS
jgi:hypothetical protein